MGKRERRAEMKRLKRENEKKQVKTMISEKEIEQKMQEILYKDLDIHWQINAPVWLKRDLWSLHVNYGWGKKRLNKYLENKVNEFKCLNSGHISDEDIEQGLKEIGVIVKL